MSARLASDGGRLTLGERIVPVRLNRSDRRTLGITVSPEGHVELRAPRDASLHAIEQRVERRQAWILEQLERFDGFHPRTPQRRYVSGESFRLRGRQYRLRIDSQRSRGVRLEGDRLVVGGVADASSVQRALAKWYGAEARRTFDERLGATVPRFRFAGLSTPKITVRRLEQRWGSMSRDGTTLILNTRLVEAAPELIDYVIAHELMHILHPDHGAAFVGTMDRLMPDWRQRKERLEHSLL